MDYLCVNPEGHLEIWRKRTYHIPDGLGGSFKKTEWGITHGFYNHIRNITYDGDFLFFSVFNPPEFWGREIIEEWEFNSNELS